MRKAGIFGFGRMWVRRKGACKAGAVMNSVEPARLGRPGNPPRLALPVILLVLLAACGGVKRSTPVEVFADMDHQQNYQPQEASAFFADGRAARPPVAGTVVWGGLKDDDAFYRGIVDGHYVGRNPLPLDKTLLKRGRERFNIYCSPCHDRAGTGRGVVAMRAAWFASDLTEARIQELSDGELFHIASHGKRSMPGYRFQMPERDRWAVVGYIRALQRAVNGTLNDVPPQLRETIRPAEAQEPGMAAPPADQGADGNEAPPSEEPAP